MLVTSSNQRTRLHQACGFGEPESAQFLMAGRSPSCLFWDRLIWFWELDWEGTRTSGGPGFSSWDTGRLLQVPTLLIGPIRGFSNRLKTIHTWIILLYTSFALMLYTYYLFNKVFFNVHYICEPKSSQSCNRMSYWVAETWYWYLREEPLHI